MAWCECIYSTRFSHSNGHLNLEPTETTSFIYLLIHVFLYVRETKL